MKPDEVLQLHNLKRTSCREGIIALMQDRANALSENEIRDCLAATYDRTTFYRSFRTLEESGIIHKIVVNSQTVRYALNHGSQQCGHAHFHCQQCSAVQCLGTVPVTPPALPHGYAALHAEMIVRGICNVCGQIPTNQ